MAGQVRDAKTLTMCACRVVGTRIDPEHPHANLDTLVVFCPLHAHAGEVVVALETAVAIINALPSDAVLKVHDRLPRVNVDEWTDSAGTTIRKAKGGA